MTKCKYWLLVIGYWLLVIGLFFYSYTQVDLNLTLSRITIWRQIQTGFQDIGWFQRPVSTIIFTVIYFLLSTFYFLLIYLVGKDKISHKQLWWLIIIASIILLFSYNAFSYDLFNYLFDARIVTLYHQNPYLQKALDYPLDPWINFMRWTHRTYPYGPVWLGLTVPLSWAGMQFFLPTLFLFKGLMTIAYLGTIYFMGKIMQKLNPERKLLAMVLLAFNPLIIIESLVSAHNDIVMMCLAMMSFYFLLEKKYLWVIIFFLLSIGIKFVTIFLLPVFILWIMFREDSGQARMTSQNTWFALCIFSMVAVVILASFRTEFQPWYLIWLLPFVFLSNKKWLITLTVIISLGVMTQYLPFLYIGNWNLPIPLIKTQIVFLSVVLGSLAALAVAVKDKKMLKLNK